MNRCLIITSRVDGLEMLDINGNDYDCIICADAGYLISSQLNLEPDILIGDYDSMPQPENKEVIKLPIEKDMTDSEAAIDLAVSKGFTDITVLGGLGGRFDHSMGNVGMLAKYCGKLDRLSFVDGQNYMFMVGPCSLTLRKNNYRFLGIIAYDGPAKGVTLKGVKFPLYKHLLTADTTLGVSNEIVDDTAEISFEEGKLLIIRSRDVDK